MKQQIFKVTYLCNSEVRVVYEIPAQNELIALAISMNKPEILGSWCQTDSRFSVKIRWLGTYSE